MLKDSTRARNETLPKSSSFQGLPLVVDYPISWSCTDDEIRRRSNIKSVNVTVVVSSMELHVSAIAQAAGTWAIIRTIPGYELVVGKILFRHIFDIAPQAFGMFSFGVEPSDPAMTITNKDQIPDAVYESSGFKVHAKVVVNMLEMVVTMMAGDELPSLEGALESLGSRHVMYGVLRAHYGVLETALLRTLEEALHHNGGHWTPEVRKGWAAVIKFIAKGMQDGAASKIEIDKVKCAILRLRVMTRSERTSSLKRSGTATRFLSEANTRDTPPSYLSSPPSAGRGKSLQPALMRRGEKENGPPKLPRRRSDSEIPPPPSSLRFRDASMHNRLPRKGLVTDDSRSSTVGLEEDKISLMVRSSDGSI